jgi:hypothetical protein
LTWIWRWFHLKKTDVLWDEVRRREIDLDVPSPIVRPQRDPAPGAELVEGLAGGEVLPLKREGRGGPCLGDRVVGEDLRPVRLMHHDYIPAAHVIAELGQDA